MVTPGLSSVAELSLSLFLHHYDFEKSPLPHFPAAPHFTVIFSFVLSNPWSQNSPPQHTQTAPCSNSPPHSHWASAFFVKLWPYSLSLIFFPSSLSTSLFFLTHCLFSHSCFCDFSASILLLDCFPHNPPVLRMEPWPSGTTIGLHPQPTLLNLQPVFFHILSPIVLW